ncbi:MAG: hypothetical protein O3B74_12425 [Proteobacteria bacterium]|nr:hypothetical protein [Pseudomonadota bacterium]MDA1310906.1 hypothetical protein [Pseudomonadota bacterium]
MSAHFLMNLRPWKVKAGGRSVIVHIRTQGLTPRWRRLTAKEVREQQALARRLGAAMLRIPASAIDGVEMAR